MATIDKLMIRGVRSYSPDEANVIEFFRPLTLISGANGSGKTTIIECLRYACTGEVPPNSSRGQAFLFDPRISGDSEIKAQIRFRFHTVTKKAVTCIRSMSLVQKPNSQQFKAFDSALITFNDAGEKLMQTVRCADLDREIPELMGISKAILDSVIFCHQEESEWPLDTASNLKKKFDDIFASTRYSKALDVIKKLRQEQAGKIRELSGELRHLKDYKTSADEKQMEINRLQDLVQTNNAKYSSLEQAILTSDAQEKDLEEQILITTQVQDFLKKAEQARKEIENLLEILKTPANVSRTETDQELQEMLNQYASADDHSSPGAQMLKASLDSLAQLMNENQVKAKRKLEEIYHIENQIKSQEEKQEQVKDMARTLVKDFGLSVKEDVAVDELISQVDGKLKMLEARQQEANTKWTSSEAATQRQINEAIEKITQLREMEKLSKEKQEEIEKSRQAFSNQLAQLKDVDSDLLKLKENITAQERLLQETRDRFDPTLAEVQIQSATDAKRAVDASVEQLIQEERQSMLSNDQRLIMEAKQKEFAKKESDLANLKQQIFSAVEEMFGRLDPETDIPATIERGLRKMRVTQESSRQDLESKKKELRSLQAKADSTSEQQSSLNKRISSLREEIEDVCLVDILPKTVQRLKAKTETLKSSVLELSHFNSFTNKFMALAAEDDWCPMCRREFDHKTTLQSFRKTVMDMKTDLPQKLMEKETELKSLETSLQKHLDQLPKYEQIQQIQSQGLAELEEQEQQLKTEIAKLQQIIKQETSSLLDLDADIDCLAALKQKCEQLETLEHEVPQMRKELNRLQAQSGPSSRLRSRQVISQQLDEERKKSRELEQLVQSLTKESLSAKESIHQQQNQLVDLRSQLKDLEQMKTTRDRLKQDLLTLQEKERKFSADTKQSQILELQQVQQKLEALRKNLDKSRQEYQELAQGLDKQIRTVKNYRERLSNLRAPLSASHWKSLETCKSQYQELKALESEHERSRADIKAKLDEELAAHKSVEEKRKEISDCLKYRSLVINLHEKDHEIETQQGLLASMGDVNPLKQRLHDLQKKRRELTQQSSMCRGEFQAQSEQLSRCQREFSQDKFRNAHENYQRAVVECKILELANADMEAYYSALEKALLKYHTQKMDEINKTIKDLWQKTYRGNDIDTIEIRAEAEEKNRSSYNYRVVMIKDEVAIDMRGRCSAGQKVLACLVIRLALADSFCSHCALLALDEPTTNLDVENVRSFVKSLTDLIAQRRQHSNFQLIVISHDEDFVQQLSFAANAEHYWRISKNPSQRSIIEKQDSNTRA
eukprot:TRINITY_DN4082_c0_g1_i3.p1 TRINITY_DN4082_c0_g1~~TRINITY_DN4082_c0_g1_i3.p1  ORF type:complete len:1299 (-),score=342.01 TRINITY_DN4082_c0_g1_i3:46-3942(-)